MAPPSQRHGVQRIPRLRETFPIPRGNTPSRIRPTGMDRMRRLWADHLDIARACEAIGEHDLGEGIAAMGASLGLLAHELWFEDLAASEMRHKSETARQESEHACPLFTHFIPAQASKGSQDSSYS